MISYRGILSLIIGIAFVGVGLNSDFFFKEQLPLAVTIAVSGVGALLIWAGVRLTQTVWRRGDIIGKQMPVPAQVVIFPERNAESGARTLLVKLDNACWALAMDLAGTSGPDLDDGVIRDGEVWIDPTTGKPLAISVDGNQLNLILVTKKILQTEFGSV